MRKQPYRREGVMEQDYQPYDPDALEMRTYLGQLIGELPPEEPAETAIARAWWDAEAAMAKVRNEEERR
jgi:hypothetical protein